MYTTSTAMLEALQEAGVDYIFANLGSDHPALVEAIAEARAVGRAVPRLITCPNEMVAMSAAHGFAQVTGRAQAVVVHVECGTQALAGAVHNAAKGRIPIFVFAGASPYTQEGELKGSRNEFIQWIQDVHDQRGIVRGYMRYDNEIRTGANVKQLVHRAMQFAHSDPKGPVYLMGAREVMEQAVEPVAIDPAHWRPIAPAALPPDGVEALAEALTTARTPLVVTSFLGRNPAAVEELTRLCRRLGIGVLESVPNYVNFPQDDLLYQGNQWNDPRQNPVLAEADVVLVIDSDVPWIPQVSRPRADARIFHIDVDPLKSQMPLWYIPALRSFRADAHTALRQLNEQLADATVGPDLVEARRSHYQRFHEARRDELTRREQPDGDVLTPEYVTACIRARVDEHTLVFNEGISNYHTIINHLRPTRPGSMFTSGGGSLGWNGGAALGGKLAAPDRTVMALTGDGSYMFSVPSSVHWMARRYGTPFLTVVYNNRGWKSPKLSTLAVHPDGHASRADDIGVSFDPPPDYAGIAAAAGGAYTAVVRRPDEVEAALDRALHAVRVEKRCAVLDMWLPHL
ncbi:thiamine pyrophosphate-requiring protein [Chelatococcus sp. SYSU_G07232]|uniref:Thiamine pyrophosphate-requiring protein n=1 Tax=Chelatococcus albus TaxID=3047466 RepID=A0ABT7ACF1_9HYPH|nr:thiamine pyrophosphate-requiring protein [Chelatococcus sp. SYSU_G07232]MDJ1157049.1 thiamine pyrophosphate-requiring protein [Chelatococcus sp. SYSU_G07232]